MSQRQRLPEDWVRRGHLRLPRVALLALALVAIMVTTAMPAVSAMSGGGLTRLARASQREVAPGPKVARLPLPLRQAAAGTPTPTSEETLQQLMEQLDAAWHQQDWPEALDLIDQIIAIDPEYDDIQERHYYAHVNYGFKLMTEGECTQSLAEFRAALELRPDGEEALRGLELIGLYCGTPTPGPGSPTVTSVPSPTPVPSASPTPQIISSPITYTVQPGDTLYSLSKRYGTTVQAIMQANGMMTYFLRAGDLIWIPTSGAPPPGPIVHIVQPGETLYSIARQYNTTVWAIMAANRLTSHTIWAYRALFVPTVMQPGAVIHIVMPGETLYTIALRHGTSVSLIMLANGLTTYDIYVYQRLIIPPEGWTGGMPWPGGPLWPGRIYVVQPGDTLYGIARRFGITVAAIQSANGLTGSTIVAGTTLRIP